MRSPERLAPRRLAVLLAAAMVASAAAGLTVGTASAQSGQPGPSPTDADVPPPPDAPPPPPDYIPPPPPPDLNEPDTGLPPAEGTDAAGGADEPPPPPDDGASEPPPPDYGTAPADVSAEPPPAPVAGGPPLEAGEAYHTRFSGTVTQPGPGGPVTVINLDGVVGSIVDLRNLGEPAVGQHVISEPQRAPATAADAGQIFGIAFDDASAPNIFVTATSAYGLHLSPGTNGWMAGLWGPESGPGAIYRLPPDTGYVPELFAEVTLDGRQNSGPALGNVAYDPKSRQLFVSDLETGMIHRLSAEDGTDLGRYDHGVDGRRGFQDVGSGQSLSLPPIEFDRSTAARIGACAAGPFERHPECWNFADFRRRIWGLAVRRGEGGDGRLYYAVWGSDAFGNADWAGAGDERRNSVWSVRLDEGGGFDASSVRREFFLPSFFEDDAAAGPMAGNSRPVSDIEFADCGARRVMLLAERGGARNLGLDAEDAFATPHESRVLRYELGDDGVWRPAGRYDVGAYERQEHGPPRLRASAGGGCDFGYGYAETGFADLATPNAFVWASGDNLCSPRAACLDPSTGGVEDTSWVDGLQGTPEDLLQDVLPDGALSAPPSEPATPPDGPESSYMIDSDVNLDVTGGLTAGTDRNQATFAGDVDVFERCAVATEVVPPPPPDYAVPMAPPPPVHLRDMTHMRNASPMHNVNRSWHERSWSWHSRDQSWHYRNRSWHQRDQSWHWRAGSWHSRDRSWHSRERSWHWKDRSWHWKNGSWHHNNRSWHNRNLTWHARSNSWHAKQRSWHWKSSSWHDRRHSWHSRDRSWHGRDRSWHARDRSWHAKDRSWHSRQESVRHDRKRSQDRDHARNRSQDRDHARHRSLEQQHDKDRSQKQQHEKGRSYKRPDGANVHSRAESQKKKPDAQHNRAQSQKRDDDAKAHNRARSQQQQKPQHNRAQSQKRDDDAKAHSRSRSQQQQKPQHQRAQSQKRDDAAKAHSRSRSQQQQKPQHQRAQSQKRDDAAKAQHSRSRSQQQQQKPKQQQQQQQKPKQQQKQQQQRQQQQKQPKPEKQQKQPRAERQQQGGDEARHNRQRSQQQ
jgi:hypothetical protein